MAGLNIRRSAV